MKLKFLILPPIVMTGLVVGLHFILRNLRYSRYFDMDQYWPVSIFLPKYPVWVDLLTLAGIALVWWAFLKMWKDGQMTIGRLTAMLFVLIIGSNALQGWKNAWVTPIGGDDTDYLHYYHDSEGISDVGKTLELYTTLQPLLRDHTRVHPPGPLLLTYWLRQIWDWQPWLSLAFLGMGMGALPLLYLILKTEMKEQWALLATALFGLIPGVQIYWLAGVDAVITTIFLAAVAVLLVTKKEWTWDLAGGLAIFLGAMMSFAVLWLVGVMLWADWWKHGRLSRSMRMMTVAGVLLWVFGILSGFSYMESFSVASSFEGTQGFYGFAKPLSYMVTRVEDILELATFAGPYVIWLVGMGLLQLGKLKVLGKVGLGGLLALGIFLAGGAYYTGETARAAGYVYPFTFLIVAEVLERIKPDLKMQFILLNLVFGQTVLMQVFGWYVW